MEDLTVIENIRTDAALEVAGAVAETIAITDGMVASEVARVGERVTEHAVVSEERHEEILEETVVCQEQTAELSSQILNQSLVLMEIRNSLQSLRESQLATAEAIAALNLRLSEGTTPSIPVPSEAPELPMESPVENAGVPEVPPTEPRRKRRVI